jgi:hypothetical protein
VLVALAASRRDALGAHRALRARVVADALEGVDDARLEALVAFLARASEGLLFGASELAARSGGKVDETDRIAIGDIELGRLRFLGGAPRLDLQGARIGDLYRAAFEGRKPDVRVEPDGTVSCRYRGFSWLGWRDTSAKVTLTSAVPWTIEIRGGVAQLHADLRELDVQGIQILGGASECDIRLPPPSGETTLRVTGGANHVVVRRPRGSAAQAVVRGGAASLTFDDQQTGSVGGTVRFATDGWDEAVDRWSIELTGGASDLSVTEE